MKSLTLLPENADGNPSTADRSALVETQTWGVIIGLVGGITTAVLGSMLTAAGWLATDRGVKHWLSTAGTELLYLTIPLILLGACCLDWLEKDKAQDSPKIARYDDEDDEL